MKSTVLRKAHRASIIVRTPSLGEQVYRQVTAGIVALEIPPGELLVIEHIALRLGVSRTPIREALPRLLAEGLIEEVSQGELRVVPITADGIREIHRARAALEGTAALLSAGRISPVALRELNAAFEKATLGLARGKYEPYFAADSAFHEQVIEACGNGHMIRILRGIHHHVDRLRSFSRSSLGPHLMASHAEHQEILEPWAAGNGGLARDLMEAHVIAAGERLAKLCS